MKRLRSSVLLAFVCMACLLSGCSASRLRNPLPERYGNTAQIPGIPDARLWGDESPKFLDALLDQSRENLIEKFPGVFGREHHYLAISGGGANGAFGAGLLAGWSAAGTRPEFTIITGVSTGALMAPFVFIGPAYDTQLKEVYTSYSTRDLVLMRGIMKIIFGSSIMDTAPLRKMLKKYIDRDVMESIAAEHRKGRRLYVGTTNLDAQRPVIWNIGLIAASGQPGALDLIHKIILASASIPAAFPPVMIDVEAGGARYDEMHVDGGATSQVFFYPTDVDWKFVMERLEVKGTPKVYVIRNSFIKPHWETVYPEILPIAGISIGSLIRTQGIGDMYRIFLDCKTDGVDYNLAYIPEDFDAQSNEDFDPVYMGKLFDLGYEMARKGYQWDKAPPGYE